MKKIMSDDEFEKGMRLLFNSEVPEEKRFVMKKQEETRVRVVRSETTVTKRVFGIVACAMSVVMAFSMISRIYTEQNEDEFDRACREITERIDECEKVFSFGEAVHSGECFRAAGLIPDGIYDLSDAEVFVYTVSDGKRKIYTGEAYTIWYDDAGEISAFTSTTEKVSDEFSETLIGAELFKGEYSSISGFRAVESMFKDRSAEVSYEGKVIRKALSYYGMPEQRLSIDKLCMYMPGSVPVPVCIYNLRGVVECRAFDDEGDIPDTSARISLYEDSTDYSLTFIYDCSRSNAIRLEEDALKNQNRWCEKTERTEK